MVDEGGDDVAVVTGAVSVAEMAAGAAYLPSSGAKEAGARAGEAAAGMGAVEEELLIGGAQEARVTRWRRGGKGIHRPVRDQ